MIRRIGRTISAAGALPAAGALLALGTLGCSRPVAPAPPLAAPSSIAVLLPFNATGDPLSVAGASALEKYALHADLVTLPDVLAAEARAELGLRGFTVVVPEVVSTATGGRAPKGVAEATAMARSLRFDGAVLYLEIRRWEPEAPFHPEFVIAALNAALIDVTTGEKIWSATHQPYPISTAGAVVVGDAYVTAAHAAIRDLLAPLAPGRTPS